PCPLAVAFNPSFPGRALQGANAISEAIMTILVTGGAGYIGSHMVHALVGAGEPVVVLDNLSTGFRYLIPSAVPFVAGSTGDRELVAKTLRHYRVTAIIHFAASIVVP